MGYEALPNYFRLSQKISRLTQRVAAAVSVDDFDADPRWAARFGERGRRKCTADFCFHLEFLAGAMEARAPAAFGDYLLWCDRMLCARGIDSHLLVTAVELLEKHLVALLLPDEGRFVSQFIREGRSTATATADTMSNGALALTRQVFLSAVLAGQRQAALNIVDEALAQGHTHVELYVDLFAETLHRVGKLRESNQVSVAQEHMATAITQYSLAHIYSRLQPPAVHRGRMVVAGVAGELHQIGANLLADTMEASGWDVHFLGTNLPHTAILTAVEEMPADVLCISTTLVANLPAASELVRLVRKELGEPGPRIVLGGAAYRLAGDFARELGSTEGVTHLRRAIELLSPEFGVGQTAETLTTA